MTAGLTSQFPSEPVPQIALSGRSNVGKSSLINTLLSRKSLARVSSTPGKTITVNFYEIDGKMFLVDLPGYGYAARNPADKEKWSKLTDGYFTNNKNSDLIKGVAQLIDSRARITEADRMMLDWMNSMGMPYIIVVTKIDKLNKTERALCLEQISSDKDIKPMTPVIAFSSLNGKGKKELWSAVASLSGINL